jgi:hypothetical protein
MINTTKNNVKKYSKEPEKLINSTNRMLGILKKIIGASIFATMATAIFIIVTTMNDPSMGIVMIVLIPLGALVLLLSMLYLILNYHHIKPEVLKTKDKKKILITPKKLWVFVKVMIGLSIFLVSADIYNRYKEVSKARETRAAYNNINERINRAIRIIQEDNYHDDDDDDDYLG